MPRKREKVGTIFIVFDKEFYPTEFAKKCREEGIDCRTTPEWREYLSQMRKKRSNNLKIKKKERKIKENSDDKILQEEAKQPLTQHPNANAVLDSEEDKIRLRRNIKRKVVDAIEATEVIKKIAKSKIPKDTFQKLRHTKKFLNQEEVDEIDLNVLKDITDIYQKATKVQLDIAKELLNDIDKDKIRKKAQEELTRNNIDFNLSKPDKSGKKQSNSGDILKNLELLTKK